MILNHPCSTARSKTGRCEFLALFFLFNILFASAMVSPIGAQNFGESIDEDADKPWHIAADEVSYDDSLGQYLARGHVTISKRDVKLSADFVRFDHKSMKALAIGNVVMTAGEDVLIGNSIEIDLATQTGTIYQGSVFLKQNHFYIKGDKLQKTGKDSYAAERASISSCDGQPPAWKITGRNLNVKLEGYGTIQNAALWARNVPVLYTPILAFPTKRKRQTGFLLPRIGDSSRNGFFFTQPFFWAIRENSDGTFYWNHIEERGEKVGGEYRYIIDSQSKGTVMYDFLEDKQIDDGTDDSSERWGYPDVPGLRPNNDRYWFRMKHDQALPYGVTGKLDIDIVSDQDYLIEWERGETGWQWTDDYFKETFGRGIDDFNDYVRKNQLNLRKGWSQWDLNMTALWFDNVIARRQLDVNPTLQRLPAIDFQGSRQPLFETPVFFRWNSQYVYFYRQDGPKAQRLDLYPRFYYPLRVKNYFTFEPSVGLRETLYYRDEDSALGVDRFNDRGIYNITADLFTEVFNVFHTGFGSIDRIKHSMRPQFTYYFIPDIDQADLPSFDDTDRIAKQNVLNYSLTNSLIARSARKSSEKADTGEGSNVQKYDYREFFRFKLEQSYDFNRLNDKEPRPFSNLAWRIDLVPFQYFQFETDGQWDPYENDFVQHNMSVTLSDIRGDRFFIERRFTQDSSDSIYLSGTLKITDKISSHAFFEQNILDDIRIQSGIGARYVSQCWAFDVWYVDDGTDRRYEFAISLSGLGQIRRSFQGRVVENPFAGPG